MIEEISLTPEEDEMNRYWDERSESYSELNMSQFKGFEKEAWENVIFSKIDNRKNLKVLDIGTGPGFFALLFALRGHKVTAVDMNDEMLKRAKSNAANTGVEIDFVKVGHSLPFNENSFDIVISRDVTWTLTKPEEQLKSWYKLLKPNGKLMYFDAEWNFHLKNSENYDKWLEIRKNIEKSGIKFYPKAEELDKIAVKLPMTYKDRPKWDMEFWESNSKICKIYENLNDKVFDATDRIHYQAHPVFLVEVFKS